MKIYIISYFGKKYKDKRISAHTRQVKFWQDKGYEVIVFANQYDEDTPFLDGVTYVIPEENRLYYTGEARNVLLNLFYKTSEDWAVFSDNDSVVFNHCNAESDLIRFNPGLHFPAEVLFPIHGSVRPYTQFHKDAKEVLSNWYSLSRDLSLASGLFWMKNIYKLKGSKLFFNTELKMWEDTDFGFKAVRHGFRMFSVENWVYKDLASNWSTIVEREGATKRNELDHFRDDLVKLWEPFGVSVDGRNALSRKEFAKQYAVYPRNILVNKSTLEVVEPKSGKVKHLIEATEE